MGRTRSVLRKKFARCKKYRHCTMRALVARTGLAPKRRLVGSSRLRPRAFNRHLDAAHHVAHHHDGRAAELFTHDGVKQYA